MSNTGVSQRRVVIIGGCGFIGSRLANRLARDTCEVAVIDVAPPPADLAPSCRVEVRDISVGRTLRGALDGADTVFLLAAKLAKLCESDPAACWATNFRGVFNVLEEIQRSNRRPRLVFTSSAAVYDSDAAHFPISELAPLRPRGMYGASKLAGEEVIAAATLANGMTSIIMRFFTVYGTGPMSGARGHFIGHWMECLTAGLPLPIHGDGLQTVDLTSVDDVVRALRAAMLVDALPGESRVYNVGSGVETRVADVAAWIAQVCPSVQIVHLPSPVPYRARLIADFSRARSDLGYEPETHPQVGIKRLALMRPGVARPV